MADSFNACLDRWAEAEEAWHALAARYPQEKDFQDGSERCKQANIKEAGEGAASVVSVPFG